MSKTYRESFGYFWASLPVLLGFAALLEGMLWLTGSTSETSSSVALIFVAYLFHRHFLFGEALTLTKQPAGTAWSASGLGTFVLVSVGVMFVPLVLGLALTFAMFDDPPFALVLLVMLALYLLALSLFGTALPAVVAKDGTFRLSQGMRMALSTMWRLVLGPGVFGFAFLILALVGDRVLESFGVAAESLIALAWFVVIRTLGFLTTILAVAVLCDMYRRTRPEPRAAQGSGGLDQTPA